MQLVRVSPEFIMFLPESLFGYIGPETLLPLTSILAAIGGVFVMFWNTIRRSTGWCLNLFRRRPAATAENADA